MGWPEHLRETFAGIVGFANVSMPNQEPLIGCGRKCGGLACSLRNVTSAGVGLAAYLRSIRARSYPVYLRLAPLLSSIFRDLYPCTGQSDDVSGISRWNTATAEYVLSTYQGPSFDQHSQQNVPLCSKKYPTVDIETSTHSSPPDGAGTGLQFSSASADPSAWFQSAGSRRTANLRPFKSSMPTLPPRWDDTRSRQTRHDN